MRWRDSEACTAECNFMGLNAMHVTLRLSRRARQELLRGVSFVRFE